MLTILNEREFDTGNERIKVPLRCVVGASNEMPKEAELEALYDRFIIRMRVDRLQDEEQLTRFLTNTAEYVAPEASLRLTKAELEAFVAQQPQRQGGGRGGEGGGEGRRNRGERE